MNRMWCGFVLLLAAGIGMTATSCGHSQELVGIQIVPSAETVGSASTQLNLDAGAQVQLRALGTYIHPPVTKDITNSVTWTTNDPQMFVISSSGMLTATGFACGSSVISATVTTNSSSGGISSSGAIVTGTMTASVVCYTGSIAVEFGKGPA